MNVELVFEMLIEKIGLWRFTWVKDLEKEFALFFTILS